MGTTKDAKIKMMNLFFDCEFTHFQEGAELPGLISIGVISSDGRCFYAENENVQPELFSEFVIDTVIPLLEGGDALMPYAEIARRLKEYIESFEGETKLWTDAPIYDWPHVQHLFDNYGWPVNLRRQPIHLLFSSGLRNMRFELAVKDMFNSNPKMHMHHALDDAIANKYAFEVTSMWRSY